MWRRRRGRVYNTAKGVCKVRRSGVVLSLVMALAAGWAEAAPPEWAQARELYQGTHYNQSLNLLLSAATKDAATFQLIGQNYFMLGQYKKATDALEKARDLGPITAELYLWLGRAWGRRAETSNPFSAPGYASRARNAFEQAVSIDISDKAAVGDLFDYYLGAPGFLGGGLNKAEDLAKKVAARDPAEGHYLEAQINDKRKQYDAAEQHLRRAAALAPKQVSRVLDLARYLAKRGRVMESDALFEQAEQMAPHNPRVLFYRAQTYINGRRNLADARKLLEQYLQAPLTPDDPPRESAQALLQKARP
jgi:tetratricopeptide (TPR) repeat protein